jgi:prephenate dehydrogenase
MRQSRANAIGIVGLGLIGGSLAKALRARFPKRLLVGVEPNAKTRALARRDGLFNALLVHAFSELSRCGIVVLCAPVPAVLRLLGPISRVMRDGAVLTDVGGVKRPIVAAARARVRRGVSFVGAHPMFGGEKGGYAAARPDAWREGVVAVCTDSASPSAVAAVARLHRALGARVVFCTAAEHDAAVAAISHLPYLLASALALTARDAGPLARRLADKGLADTTRLAAFAYEVQGEAVRANACLRHAARALQRDLRHLLAALGTSRPRAKAALDRARRAKESLSGDDGSPVRRFRERS